MRCHPRGGLASDEAAQRAGAAAARGSRARSIASRISRKPLRLELAVAGALPSESSDDATSRRGAPLNGIRHELPILPARGRFSTNAPLPLRVLGRHPSDKYSARSRQQASTASGRRGQRARACRSARGCRGDVARTSRRPAVEQVGGDVAYETGVSPSRRIAWRREGGRARARTRPDRQHTIGPRQRPSAISAARTSSRWRRR